MLEEYFDSSIRIKEIRGGTAGPLLEGFAQELYQAGYARLTACRHLRAAEHLVYWTCSRGIPVSSLEERFIKEFSQHLNLCRCTGYGRLHRLKLENGVRLFIGYLRRTGVLTTLVNEEPIEKPTLLVSFDNWMRQQRGTCNATLYNYGLDLRDLLKKLGEDPARFHAQALRNFVLERTQRCGWAAAKRCTTAVRAFLRFLIADGRCTAGLDAAIPAFAHWRLSALPRYL
ncbi:MAG: site-specific integrase [Acidobacteriaceae bacterium]